MLWFVLVHVRTYVCTCDVRCMFMMNWWSSYPWTTTVNMQRRCVILYRYRWCIRSIVCDNLCVMHVGCFIRLDQVWRPLARWQSPLERQPEGVRAFPYETCPTHPFTGTLQHVLVDEVPAPVPAIALARGPLRFHSFEFVPRVAPLTNSRHPPQLHQQPALHPSPIPFPRLMQELRVVSQQ